MPHTMRRRSASDPPLPGPGPGKLDPDWLERLLDDANANTFPASDSVAIVLPDVRESLPPPLKTTASPRR